MRRRKGQRDRTRTGTGTGRGCRGWQPRFTLRGDGTLALALALAWRGRQGRRKRVPGRQADRQGRARVRFQGARQRGR